MQLGSWGEVPSSSSPASSATDTARGGDNARVAVDATAAVPSGSVASNPLSPPALAAATPLSQRSGGVIGIEAVRASSERGFSVGGEGTGSPSPGTSRGSGTATGPQQLTSPRSFMSFDTSVDGVSVTDVLADVQLVQQLPDNVASSVSVSHLAAQARDDREHQHHQHEHEREREDEHEHNDHGEEQKQEQEQEQELEEGQVQNLLSELGRSPQPEPPLESEEVGQGSGHRDHVHEAERELEDEPQDWLDADSGEESDVDAPPSSVGGSVADAPSTDAATRSPVCDTSPVAPAPTAAACRRLSQASVSAPVPDALAESNRDARCGSPLRSDGACAPDRPRSSVVSSAALEREVARLQHQLESVVNGSEADDAELQLLESELQLLRLECRSASRSSRSSGTYSRALDPEDMQQRLTTLEQHAASQRQSLMLKRRLEKRLRDTILRDVVQLQRLRVVL